MLRGFFGNGMQKEPLGPKAEAVFQMLQKHWLCEYNVHSYTFLDTSIDSELIFFIKLLQTHEVL